MNRLIFTAFAFKQGYETSAQTGKKASLSTVEMYMENIFVALTSAKLHNPQDTVMLVTNIPPAKEWGSRFQEAGIKILQIPFDTYILPQRFLWSLAFYKLCALKALLAEGTYQQYLMLDNDTYTTGPYDELWLEAQEALLFYPVGHAYLHPDRQIITREWKKLYPDKTGCPVHLGGEFAAGSLEELRRFMKLADGVYQKIQEIDFCIDEKNGDETIWSIAALLAEEERIPVRSSGPYLYRFWTEAFYLVSTVTVANPVRIWHLPSEKANGIPRLYQYYQSSKSYPTVTKAAAFLGIAIPKRPFNLYTLVNKITGKIKKIMAG